MQWTKCPKLKNPYIESGIRYDLLLHRGKDEKANAAAENIQSNSSETMFREG